MRNLNQAYFGILVDGAKRMRDNLVPFEAPLPIYEVVPTRDQMTERALARVRESVADFVMAAHQSTPAEAASLQMQIEDVLVELTVAADVAKDRSLGPRTIQNGAA